MAETIQNADTRGLIDLVDENDPKLLARVTALGLPDLCLAGRSKDHSESLGELFEGIHL